MPCFLMHSVHSHLDRSARHSGLYVSSTEFSSFLVIMKRAQAFRHVVLGCA